MYSKTCQVHQSIAKIYDTGLYIICCIYSCLCYILCYEALEEKNITIFYLMVLITVKNCTQFAKHIVLFIAQF